MTTAVDAAVRAAARWGLPTVEVAECPVLDRHEWLALLHVIRRERIVLLLDAAVRGGAISATSEQADGLAAEAAQARDHVRRLDLMLADVVERFGAAGVEVRALKGPAVARLDALDPSLRAYGDVDVLVRSRDVAAALELLGRAGFRRDLPERRAGFDRRFAKEVPVADGNGTEIDVHRSLALGAFGAGLDLDALWERTDGFVVEGRRIAALDAEGRFVHACLNAVLGDERPRIVALRDVVEIEHRHPLDEGRIARLLPPGRGGAIVDVARRLAHDVLGTDVVGEPVTPSRWERVALRCYRARGGSNTLEIASTALGLGASDAAAFLVATVAPSRAYRRARDAAGRPREIRTGIAEIVRSLGRRASASDGGDGDDGGPPVAPPGRSPDAGPRKLPARRIPIGDVEIDGQRVLWDPATGRVTRLDETASIIWACLDGTSPVDDLVDDLAGAFDADRAVVAADVEALLARLTAVGAVVWPDESPVP